MTQKQKETKPAKPKNCTECKLFGAACLGDGCYTTEENKTCLVACWQ